MTPQPPRLTAAQMADTCWAMLSAAVAAGRLIEARGWMRLHEDLQPFAREGAAAALRAAEQAREDEVRLQLDCFSPAESNTAGPAP